MLNHATNTPIIKRDMSCREKGEASAVKAAVDVPSDDDRKTDFEMDWYEYEQWEKETF